MGIEFRTKKNRNKKEKKQKMLLLPVLLSVMFAACSAQQQSFSWKQVPASQKLICLVTPNQQFACRKPGGSTHSCQAVTVDDYVKPLHFDVYIGLCNDEVKSGVTKMHRSDLKADICLYPKNDKPSVAIRIPDRKCYNWLSRFVQSQMTKDIEPEKIGALISWADLKEVLKKQNEKEIKKNDKRHNHTF